MRADGSAARRVTGQPHGVLDFAWAPSGKEFVFAAETSTVKQTAIKGYDGKIVATTLPLWRMGLSLVVTDRGRILRRRPGPADLSHFRCRRRDAPTHIRSTSSDRPTVVGGLKRALLSPQPNDLEVDACRRQIQADHPEARQRSRVSSRAR